MADIETGTPVAVPNLDKDVKSGRRHNVTPNYMIFRLRKALARGIHYSLPGTDGEVKSVFYATLWQDHTIISIFKAHPLHPFSRCERVWYLFNIMSWMLFFSFITRDVPEKSAFWISLLITIFFMKPWKMLNHCVLACSCLYTGAYDEANDKEDGDSNPLNNNRATSIFEFGVNCFGSCAAMYLSLISLNLWLVVLIITTNDANGFTFFGNWLYLQMTNYCVYEPLFALIFTYLNINYLGEKSKFDRHWEPYFQRHGCAAPVSQTQIAILAKERYCRLNECDASVFKTKFPDYDDWFLIEEGQQSGYEMTGVSSGPTGGTANPISATKAEVGIEASERDSDDKPMTIEEARAANKVIKDKVRGKIV